MKFSRQDQSLYQTRIMAQHLIVLQIFVLSFIAQSALASESNNFSKENVVSSSRNYGIASGTLQRIDDLLNSAGHNLSKPEYYDFQSRLYSLRQSALLELSRGEDASTVNQAALKLESEIQSNLKGLGKRAQLETAVNSLNADFKNKESSLNFDDKIEIAGRIEAIKEETNKEFLALGDNQIDSILARIRQVHLDMVDRVLFKNRKNTSISTDRDFGDKVHLRDDLSKTDNRIRRPESGNTKSRELGSSSEKEHGGLKKPEFEHTKFAPAVHHPKKPAPTPVIKVMEKIENDLLEYHEKNQIGSFDMDSFTSRLLAQKKNLHVMMSKTGRISLRQETLIRAELEKLQEDISNRVLGKD